MPEHAPRPAPHVVAPPRLAPGRARPWHDEAEDSLIAWALGLSVALHLVLALLAARIPVGAERAEARLEPVVVKVVDGGDESGPPPASADTLSAADTEAESPVPEPPAQPEEPDLPASTGDAPVMDRPASPPPTADDAVSPVAPGVESSEQPSEKPTEAPEETEDAVGIGPPAAETDKRALVENVLRGLREPSRSWGDVATDLPEVPGGLWGGNELQFESKADVDWGPYARRIKAIVRSNWRIPTAAQVGVAGIVRLHFFVLRDGSVEDLAFVDESGEVPLDVAAKDAIALSHPLPPPPLPESEDEDRVGVTWTFIYNVEEREYRLWERQRRR